MGAISVTQKEFIKEFDSLRLHYPSFAMPDIQTVRDIYFSRLSRFSLEIFNRALPEILRAHPQYFPSCGVVTQQCEMAQADQRRPGAFPRARYHAADHGCHLEARQEMDSFRQALHSIAPYEADHVFCAGKAVTPICPWCGMVQAPWVNPFIESMIEANPVETEFWNPMHKGTLLCDTCSRLDWPSMKYRGARGGDGYYPPQTQVIP
jgi:hypothetical protein